MLRDWSDSQKRELLLALQQYGVANVKKIAENISDKSLDDVKIGIAAYERAAILSLRRDVKAALPDRKAPIDGWLDILRHVSTEKYASDDIATAFRLISKYGVHNQMDVVNLRDCYEYIADLMMGKAPKKLELESMEFIMSCILQIGDLIYITGTKREEEFLSKLKMSEIMQKTYGSKNTNVCCDPAINALKVPAHLLKMDKSTPQ